MVQQMCSASTHMCGLFSPPSARSKLHIPIAEDTRGAVHPVKCGVSNNVQKQDAIGTGYKPFNGNSSARYSQKSRLLVKLSSGVPLESVPESSGPKSIWDSFKHQIDVFYRFSRAYALLGRIIAVLSMSVLAMEKLSDFSPLYVKGVLKALVATILMHLYINGLNQLTDIEIDKVNKPYLPLASGDYSYGTVALITVVSAILSFCIGWAEGSLPLFCALFGIFFVGTVYSLDLPLLRWKKHGFLAAVCLVALLGLIPTAPYYLHFKMHFLRKPAVLSQTLMFATSFMSLFSVTIALIKDIPDMEGDKIFDVQTFTSRLGPKRVFWTCITLLEMAYGAAIFVGAVSPNLWNKLAMILGHSVMGLILWERAKCTDLKSQEATQSFYMFLWKLFYAEFLLIPFVRF